MTTPIFLLSNIIEPLMTNMALTADIAIPVSDQSKEMLLAIAGQESSWKCRRQNGGPARGYWEFEKGGGLAGVINLFPTKVSALCNGFDIPNDIATIFEAIAWHDPVACGLARFLLWSDPRPLPALGDVNGSWQYYLDTWRPGVPRPDDWPSVYNESLTLVKGSK